MTGLSQHLDDPRRSSVAVAPNAEPGSAARPLVILALLLFLFSVSACRANYSEYRFKMTVEVETPAGLRSGSSIYEASASNQLPGSDLRGWDVKGEAVAVDLPGNRTLFALLKTNAHFGDMVGLSMQALDPQFLNPPRFVRNPSDPDQRRIHKYDVVRSARRIEQRDGVSSPATVDPATYPMLVTFADIDDPTSVTLVDPDDVAATFGEGYALKRITVQITDDPVATGIDDRLGWLGEADDGGLDSTMGVTPRPTLAQQLAFSDFRRK